MGQFFRDVLTIVYGKVLCQLGQHHSQPFSELQVQLMPYILLSHKVGEIFRGGWHGVQFSDHYCGLGQPWETEPTWVPLAVFCVVLAESLTHFQSVSNISWL